MSLERDGAMASPHGSDDARLNRRANIQRESTMTATIQWRHDVERALEDAGTQHKHVLLDFSAAPM
jgi:hypothetical protein